MGILIGHAITEIVPQVTITHLIVLTAWCFPQLVSFLILLNQSQHVFV